MDDQTDNILKGLKTAIEAELTGYQFYRNAARSTQDSKGRETFLRMAEEEMSHFNELRRQYKSVAEKGDYDFSKKSGKKAHGQADSPIFSDEIKARIKESHFEVSALTIGMKLELDAMKFYQSCADGARSEEEREFFAGLAEWEEGHYRAFERELSVLKEEYFQANNFFPM
jgi:rubrerythrin